MGKHIFCVVMADFATSVSFTYCTLKLRTKCLMNLKMQTTKHFLPDSVENGNNTNVNVLFRPTSWVKGYPTKPKLQFKESPLMEHKLQSS